MIFGQKEPIKVENFKLWAAYIKFHQFCVLYIILWSVPALHLQYSYKILAEKYGGVISHDPEDWCKFWRKTDLWFAKWHEKFGKFSPEHLIESVKIGTSMGSLCPKSLKYTEELCVMTMIWRIMQKLNEEEVDLSFQNWHQKFNEFWLEHSKI